MQTFGPVDTDGIFVLAQDALRDQWREKSTDHCR
jgi:hypothetical protein